MRKLLLAVVGLLSWSYVSAQTTSNISTSVQNCQGDSIEVFFAISSPFNATNTFKVELSDNSGVFSGNYIEFNPLLAANVGFYSMDALIPETTPQGAYKIRLVSTNPIQISDTISNIIIGKNPETTITVVNTFQSMGEHTLCEGDTAILYGPTPNPGDSYDYQWMAGGSPLSGETADSLLVTMSGAYAIEVSLGQCDATSNDTIVNTYTPPAEVYVVPGPGVQLQGMDTVIICAGTQITLNAASFTAPDIDLDFQWLKDDSLDIWGNPVIYASEGDTTNSIQVDSAGVWYITTTSTPGGCIDTSRAFYVISDTMPTTSVQTMLWPGQTLPTTTLCMADSVLLSATDTVLGTTWVYQWEVAYPAGSGSWTALPNDTMPWMVVDTSLVPDTADYRLVVTNGMCEYIANTTTVDFVPYPTIAIAPGDSLGICEGDSVLVHLTSNALSFSWDGGAYVGAANYLKDEKRYVVEASGVNGCLSYDTLDVYHYDVTATAFANPPIVSPGEDVLLTGSGGNSFYWFADVPAYFSNQSNAVTLATPIADTTTFYVRVSDFNGCDDTAMVQVIVMEQDSAIIWSQIYNNVMNVITPNADGKNDNLDLSGVMNGDECKIEIYTRWGTPVYTKEVYDNTWTGTTDGGDQLPDGTYYVILTHNNEIRYKGAVTVLNNI